MEITQRMRQILDLLLRSPYESTVAEIAQSIRVSPRTVHRELDAVESYLHRRGILLHRKAGSGLSLDGEPERLEHIKSELLTPANAEYSADERQIYLLYRLLESHEPIKLYALAHEMKVTVSTISADLDDLTDWIDKQKLRLIRRRGYGVEIKGSEPAIREAIRDLVGIRFDDLTLISGADQNFLHPVDRRIASMAGVNSIRTIEEILWKWEEQSLEESFSEEAYTDLLIHLSIAADRIGSKREISEAEAGRMLRDRQGAPDEQIVEVESLCHHLGEALKLEYSTFEMRYTASLLEKARGHASESLPADDLELAGAVRSLIHYMAEFDDQDYMADRSLRDGLFTHLGAALERITAGQRIRNPLMDTIRKEYGELFGRVRQAAHAAFPNSNIPDEEIAFLVMHFGASRERIGQIHPNMRVVIVCTSGIGSSKLLAVRLRREFPQIKIVGQASWYEAVRIPRSDYDLIISTVELPLREDQYLKLSPLLNEEETVQLRNYIKGRGSRQLLQEQMQDSLLHHTIKEDLRTAEKTAVNQEQPVGMAAIEDLRYLNKSVQLSIEILEAFRVIPLQISGTPSLMKWLQAACHHPQIQEAVKEPDVVAKLLLDREKNGTQMIPGTELALFHTRSDTVKRPLLMLFELDHSFSMEEPGAAELSRFLLMLAPKQLSRESIEVLSEISATLLDIEIMEALANGQEQQIRELMSAHLRTYLLNKLERE